MADNAPLSNNNNNITIIIDLNNIKNRLHLFSSIKTWRQFSRANRGAAGNVMIRMGNGNRWFANGGYF